MDQWICRGCVVCGWCGEGVAQTRYKPGSRSGSFFFFFNPMPSPSNCASRQKLLTEQRGEIEPWEKLGENNV